MNTRNFFLSLPLAVAALTAAYAQSPGSPGSSMPGDAAATHLGVGVVKAVDQNNRSLTIAHQDIPSMGMRAMTMSFHAEPAVSIATVKPGDSIAFVLSPRPGGPVISSLQPVAGGTVAGRAPSSGMQGMPHSGGGMGGMNMGGMSMEQCHEMMMKPRS